jgi:hypothetical protein
MESGKSLVIEHGMEKVSGTRIGLITAHIPTAESQTKLAIGFYWNPWPLLGPLVRNLRFYGN